MSNISKQVLDEIKAFVKERDAVLIEGNLDKLRAFQKKHNPQLGMDPDDRVLEISLHKARTAAKSLPTDIRKASKQWLTERNYTSMDDGDL